MTGEPVLLAALRRAPRRYRLPPLPADVASARAAGADTALAYAIEQARLGRADDAVRELFVEALARAICAALDPHEGDAAFQALVMRARHPQVHEHVLLAGQQHADRRALRAIVDAFAHPGKLQALPPSALRERLAHLHALSRRGAWSELHALARALAGDAAAADFRTELDALLAHEALARLERSTALLQYDAVQDYLALCGKRGPLAGGAAASAKGRAAARTGATAEAATVEALARIATLFDSGEYHPRHRAVRSLRAPAGFPGGIDKAKDEWDAALLAGAAIVLLVEVKASPPAATPDYARLQRGLQRLAQAEADRVYNFASAQGELEITGESLRRLQPEGRSLPPHVIYACTAAPEAQPVLLSAASKAVLLAERPSVEFGRLLSEGVEPPVHILAPVWDALQSEPRLRSALHQDDTSRAAREAMLHPDDLVASVVEILGGP